jgi:hypothetical protein
MTSRRQLAAVFASFAALSVVYLAGGDFSPNGDCKPSVFQPVVILNSHSYVFTPHNAPFMFSWRLRTEHGEVSLPHRAWRFEDAVPARAALERAGLLRVGAERYYLSPTRVAGEYVNNYGPLPGLMLLPPFAVLHAVFGDLRLHPALIWQGAKAVVALLTVLAAFLLFATARRWATLSQAALVTFTFALGSVAWPVASQTPYQQSFSLPWLALGLWAGSRAQHSLRAALVCGLGLGLAVAVRAPLACYPLAVGAWLLVPAARATLHRQPEARAAWARLLAYGLAGSIPVALVLAYNLHFFGSLSGFGQLQRAAGVHSGDAWQTPLLTGVLGLLFSPARGLLVYSPVLGFAAYGAVRVFRGSRWTALRPFTVGALVIFVLYAKWTVWWGGWTYGPRLLLDVVPVACLLLLPAWESVATRSAGRVVFGVALGWSVLTAWLGACVYDLHGWNAREAYRVKEPRSGAVAVVFDRDAAASTAAALHARVETIHMDVDTPRYRWRLWSWTDSPLVYYAEHFTEARALRRTLMRLAVQDPVR